MYGYHSWLRSFHAVANSGSFTKGADVIGVGQPTVSNQVAKLESRFGVKLFERGTKVIKLTDYGQHLYAITSKMFIEEVVAVEYLRSIQGGCSGLIKLGAALPKPSLDLRDLLIKEMPGYEVRLSVASQLIVMNKLLGREIDFALVVGNEEIDQNAALGRVLFDKDCLMVLVPDTKEWGNKNRMSLVELSNYPFINREKTSQIRILLEHALSKRGCRPVNAVIEIDNREALMFAIIQGKGITVIAREEYVPIPGTKIISLQDDDVSLEYKLIYLKINCGEAVLSKVRSAIEVSRSKGACITKKLQDIVSVKKAEFFSVFPAVFEYSPYQFF